MGHSRYNPLPYSPLLTRFDQDGDGDFDLQDVKLILKRRGNKTKCGVITKAGTPCQHQAKEKYGNRCHLHKKHDKAN